MPAAPAIQAPLSSNVTEELDMRFHFATLWWRYRYCRWREPNQRYTQRVWWLSYKKDAVLPAEADCPPPDYARPPPPPPPPPPSGLKESTIGRACQRATPSLLTMFAWFEEEKLMVTPRGRSRFTCLCLTLQCFQ